MSITEDDFRKKGSNVEPKGERTESTKQKVEDFLRENADKAWSTKEIADELDLIRATVNQTCLKLAASGRTKRMDVDGTLYNSWNPDFVEAV